MRRWNLLDNMDMSTGAVSSQGNFQAAVKYVMKLFIEKKHYRQLNQALTDAWAGTHSLSSAIRLLEAHGVKIPPEEEERLLKLPEDRMIDALVMRMPQGSKEQFEHFFLQLTLIASTTSRLREALQRGQPEVILQVLDNSEDVGILNFILKMAVAQAGSEVRTRHKDHSAYLKDASEKMEGMLDSQASLVASQKHLAQMRMQLNRAQESAAEKSRSVLGRLAATSDTGLVYNMFAAWVGLTASEKWERVLKTEYQDKFEDAMAKLCAYKAKQLELLKKNLMRGCDGRNQDLLKDCLMAFGEHRLEEQKERKREKTRAAIAVARALYDAEHSSAALRVMSRMVGDIDTAVVATSMAEWQNFVADVKAEKETAEEAKQSKIKVDALLAKQSEGARSVLGNMAMAMDSVLCAEVLKAWYQILADEKAGKELQETLDAKAGQLANFSGRNKGTAMGEMQRMIACLELGCISTTFRKWKEEARMSRLRRLGHEKNLQRKHALSNVKGLFKDFASELETGLKDGTPRVEVRRRRD